VETGIIYGTGGIFMPIGEEIRRMRDRKRVSMPLLSEAVGTPASTIYLWEKNRLVPDARDIEALARFFGVPVSALTGAPASAADEAPETEPPRVAAALDAAQAPNAGSGFDMMLITRVYHSIRDETENASHVELATARNLLQESLKIVKARIKAHNDQKKAASHE
jgi:transcriptional regulator with XRE-family HTH domain